MCVCPKGSLEASWGPVTPLCLRLACCQSVFVMTVGLLLYRLNHRPQLFIYWPNPRQPLWHLTHTHTHTHTTHTSNIVLFYFTASISLFYQKTCPCPPCEDLYTFRQVERKKMKRKGGWGGRVTKRGRGEGQAKGRLTSDLCVVAGALGGQRTQQAGVISNFRLDTTHKQREEKHNKIQSHSNLIYLWMNLCQQTFPLRPCSGLIRKKSIIKAEELFQKHNEATIKQ